MKLKNKIFCIGFHKTGTTSLHKALHILGFRVCGQSSDLLTTDNEIDIKQLHNIVSRFDAFEDNPWPLLFKELDKAYPNSKFILTYRNEEKWLGSVVNHFGKKGSPMRNWIYGYAFPVGNEDAYSKRYRSHNAEVRTYFKNRREDLLELSFENGDGWDEMCTFLKVAKPKEIFPFENKGQYDMLDRIKKWFGF